MVVLALVSSNDAAECQIFYYLLLHFFARLLIHAFFIYIFKLNLIVFTYKKFLLKKLRWPVYLTLTFLETASISV